MAAMAISPTDGRMLGALTLEYERREPMSLLSVLAHELRAPLTALTLSSELLADNIEVLDRDQIFSMVSTIRGRAIGLQEFVENTLCADAIRDGRLPVRLAVMDIHDALHEAYPLAEALTSRKGQSLRVTEREVPPSLLGDRRRIGQVLVNLISNASKFSPVGASIELIITGHPGRVRTIVADRGPGFPDGLACKLFEPFYRASSDVEGTGLGLAIVRSIVEAHGGSVGAENRPDGGAQFWFDLPLSLGNALADGISLTTTAERRA